MKGRFRWILKNYHNTLNNMQITKEMDFIKRTVDSFSDINISQNDQSISTRTGKIHQTPRIRYYPNGLLFTNVYHQIEMGDILLIYKYVVNGTLIYYRGVIVQVKHTNTKKHTWHIDSNQFKFLVNWPIFEIVLPRCNRYFYIQPQMLSWATYTFVGKNATRYPIYYSSSRMAQHRRMQNLQMMPNRDFSFSVKPHFNWDCSGSYFMKFIQGLIGENLLKNNNARDLVHNICIMSGLEPDPPGEPDWREFKKSDEETFGVIEFTVKRNIQSENSLINEKPF